MKTLWICCVLYFFNAGAYSIKPYKGGGCLPGELVLVDCNLCTCNKHGRPNEICARMWCFPQKPKTIPPSVVGSSQEMIDSGYETEQEAAEQSEAKEKEKIIGNSDEDIRQSKLETLPIKIHIATS